jgi:alanine racemase
MIESFDAHRCWAEIDRTALRHNAQVARKLVGPDVALLAVIKANGYGHGLVPVADALRDHAQLFGVANLQEALAARSAVPHPVIILGPALPAERAAIVEHRFIASISSHDEALAFSAVAKGRAVYVNCKIDTGMGRMGIHETDAVAEIVRISKLPDIEIHSVSSHLPSADEDPDFTKSQLARFDELMERLRHAMPGSYLIHTLPSAGVIAFAQSAHDIVRAGLMMYGISPLAEQQPLLRPVMTLKAHVVLLREVAAGSSISYGRTFIATRPMRVATLSVGYADGLPRALSNRGAAVLIGGRRCAILGRVTMDLTMVDVSDVPQVNVGDEAVLIGRQGDEEILASEVAQRANTIAWEIFTGIGSRVARVYV